jgi:hypothetical protein
MDALWTVSILLPGYPALKDKSFIKYEDALARQKELRAKGKETTLTKTE